MVPAIRTAAAYFRGEAAPASLKHRDEDTTNNPGNDFRGEAAPASLKLSHWPSSGRPGASHFRGEAAPASLKQEGPEDRKPAHVDISGAKLPRPH